MESCPCEEGGMGMDHIRALLACKEKKRRLLSVRRPDQGLYWRVWRRSIEPCPCEEGGMSMDQIRGFTGVHGEGAWSLVRARRVV